VLGAGMRRGGRGSCNIAGPSAVRRLAKTASPAMYCIRVCWSAALWCEPRTDSEVSTYPVLLMPPRPPQLAQTRRGYRPSEHIRPLLGDEHSTRDAHGGQQVINHRHGEVHFRSKPCGQHDAENEHGYPVRCGQFVQPRGEITADVVCRAECVGRKAPGQVPRQVEHEGADAGPEEVVDGRDPWPCAAAWQAA